MRANGLLCGITAAAIFCAASVPYINADASANECSERPSSLILEVTTTPENSHWTFYNGDSVSDYSFSASDRCALTQTSDEPGRINVGKYRNSYQMKYFKYDSSNGSYYTDSGYGAGKIAFSDIESGSFKALINTRKINYTEDLYFKTNDVNLKWGGYTAEDRTAEGFNTGYDTPLSFYRYDTEICDIEYSISNRMNRGKSKNSYAIFGVYADENTDLEHTYLTLAFFRHRVYEGLGKRYLVGVPLADYYSEDDKGNYREIAISTDDFDVSSNPRAILKISSGSYVDDPNRDADNPEGRLYGLNLERFNWTRIIGGGVMATSDNTAQNAENSAVCLAKIQVVDLTSRQRVNVVRGNESDRVEFTPSADSAVTGYEICAYTSVSSEPQFTEVVPSGAAFADVSHSDAQYCKYTVRQVYDNLAAGTRLYSQASGWEDIDITVDTNTVVNTLTEDNYGVNTIMSDSSPVTHGYLNSDGSVSQNFLSDVSDFACRRIRFGGGHLDWRKQLRSFAERQRDMQGAFSLFDAVKLYRNFGGETKFSYIINLESSDEEISEMIECYTANGDINGNGVDASAYRKAQGIEEPIKIVAWELANETDNLDSWTKEKYIAECKRVIPIVRAADPNAKIAVHSATYGLAYPEDPDFEMYRSWHIDLLKALADDPKYKIDYLVSHKYSRSDLDIGRYMEHPVAFYEEDIKKYGGQNSNIKIFLSEHANARDYWYTTNPANGWTIRMTHALGGVIAEAETFNRLSVYPSIGKSSSFVIMNANPFGSTNYNAAENKTYTTPMYDLMNLYYKNGTGNVLDSSITGFTHREMNREYGTSVMAVQSGDKIRLFVSNRSDSTYRAALNINDSVTLLKTTTITGDNVSDYHSIYHNDENYKMTSEENTVENVTSLAVPARSVVLYDLQINSQFAPPSGITKTSVTSNKKDGFYIRLDFGASKYADGYEIRAINMENAKTLFTRTFAADDTKHLMDNGDGTYSVSVGILHKNNIRYEVCAYRKLVDGTVEKTEFAKTGNIADNYGLTKFNWSCYNEYGHGTKSFLLNGKTRPLNVCAILRAAASLEVYDSLVYIARYKMLSSGEYELVDTNVFDPVCEVPKVTYTDLVPGDKIGVFVIKNDSTLKPVWTETSAFEYLDTSENRVVEINTNTIVGE